MGEHRSFFGYASAENRGVTVFLLSPMALLIGIATALVACGEDQARPSLSPTHAEHPHASETLEPPVNQTSWAPTLAVEESEEPSFVASGFAPMDNGERLDQEFEDVIDVEDELPPNPFQVSLPTEWRGHWTSRFTTGDEGCSACALSTQGDAPSCCQVSEPGPDWKIGDEGREMVVSFPHLVNEEMEEIPRFWPEVDYGCLGQGKGFLSVYWRCVDGSFDCAVDGLHGNLQLGTRSCFYIERGYEGAFRPGSGSCGAPWNADVPGVDTLLVAWNEIEVVSGEHYRGVGRDHPLFCPNPRDIRNWIEQDGVGDTYEVSQNVRTRVMLLKGGFAGASEECAASSELFMGQDTNHWTCK